MSSQSLVCGTTAWACNGEQCTHCNFTCNSQATVRTQFPEPGNLTYLQFDRAKLVVDGLWIGLSFAAKESAAALKLLHCQQDGTIARISADGVVFSIWRLVESEARTEHSRVPTFVKNNSVFISQAATSTKLLVQLRHIAHQAMNDPPCPQSLTLRTHCPGETLWFGHLAKYILTNPDTRKAATHEQPEVTDARRLPTCQGWNGEWARGNFIIHHNGKAEYQASNCALPSLATAFSVLEAVSIRLIGDSTARALSLLIKHWFPRARVMFHWLSYTDGSQKKSLWGIGANWSEGEAAFRRTDVVIILTGLHQACYRPSLQREMDLLRLDLEKFFRHVPPRLTIVRSIAVTSDLGRIDFVTDKCLYYTEERVVQFNAHLRNMATKFTAHYWDVYTLTADVVPGRLGSDVYAPNADGTHWCQGVHGYDASPVCTGFARTLLAVLRGMNFHNRRSPATA